MVCTGDSALHWAIASMMKRCPMAWVRQGLAAISYLGTGAGDGQPQSPGVVQVGGHQEEGPGADGGALPHVQVGLTPCQLIKDEEWGHAGATFGRPSRLHPRVHGGHVYASLHSMSKYNEVDNARSSQA